MDQLKATEPDAVAKGLQRRTTYKTGSATDKIKNRLPRHTGRRPDWGTPGIATGENERHATLLANPDPELQRVCRRSSRTRLMEK